MRAGNETPCCADPVYVIADGMGGHAAGEVASAIAVSTMSELAGARLAPDLVVAQVREANRRVRTGGQGQGRQGMGTTLTGVVGLADGDWLVVNVGDSRVLLIRDGEIRQLTTDHSEVQVLVDRGLLTPEEAASHPRRHIVTRSLGADDDVDVADERTQFMPGDRVLVCSDGLTDEVTADDIYWVMDTAENAQDAADALVAAALSAGGRDNVTVIVMTCSRPRRDVGAVTWGDIAVVLDGQALGVHRATVDGRGGPPFRQAMSSPRAANSSRRRGSVRSSGWMPRLSR